ncbi:aromatic acid exporter family protein [Paenibacillus profundus]|uniref:Aromatic acid exporter family protein n=1 Tax=Paenibacillus profundus TaxID=1173085 RepID=A0ABS8YN05_9BACL|nr:aromatic acid exporter family protein [Paenibacillus profundus]MCE5171690.1 aromatic acid exporter family protein [Paenibacillus profundus]
MAFGARVLKTGIAVTLSLYISMFLQFKTPVIAAVAAIFAMQPSIYRSWRYFLDQFQTNTVGAVVALLAGMAFSNAPIAVGIVCILVIMICLKMKMEETVGLTLVTVITVMEASGQWNYALIRFVQILIGIGSAFLINILFFPPNPKVQFIGQIQTVFNKMSLLLRTIISDEIKEAAFRTEKQALEDIMKSLADKYKLFEEETKKLKRAKYRATRQLVVYKHLLNTLWKGMAVLNAIEEHYFQTTRTPETNKFFDHHLEMLIKCHEHVLLKFEDKVKPDSTEIELMEAENELFMQKAMQHCVQEQEGMLRLSIVAASMYEYGFQIARLDRLVGHVDKEEDKGLLNGLI